MHHRHFLQLEAHLAVGEHGLHVAAERGHPVQLDGLQVVGGQHRDDAGHGERLRLVDRLDAGVRVGAAHDRAEQHAGKLDVVDVSPPAAEEAGVLLAQAGRAHPLQLAFALERVGRGGHDNPPISRDTITRDADASFFAACCTALTMFW